VKLEALANAGAVAGAGTVAGGGARGASRGYHREMLKKIAQRWDKFYAGMIPRHMYE